MGEGGGGGGGGGGEGDTTGPVCEHRNVLRPVGTLGTGVLPASGPSGGSGEVPSALMLRWVIDATTQYQESNQRSQRH